MTDRANSRELPRLCHKGLKGLRRMRLGGRRQKRGGGPPEGLSRPPDPHVAICATAAFRPRVERSFWPGDTHKCTQTHKHTHARKHACTHSCMHERLHAKTHTGTHGRACACGFANEELLHAALRPCAQSFALEEARACARRSLMERGHRTGEHLSPAHSTRSRSNCTK